MRRPPCCSLAHTAVNDASFGFAIFSLWCRKSQFFSVACPEQASVARRVKLDAKIYEDLRRSAVYFERMLRLLFSVRYLMKPRTYTHRRSTPNTRPAVWSHVCTVHAGTMHPPLWRRAVSNGASQPKTVNKFDLSRIALAAATCA